MCERSFEVGRRSRVGVLEGSIKYSIIQEFEQKNLHMSVFCCTFAPRLKKRTCFETCIVHTCGDSCYSDAGASAFAFVSVWHRNDIRPLVHYESAHCRADPDTPAERQYGTRLVYVCFGTVVLLCGLIGLLCSMFALPCGQPPLPAGFSTYHPRSSCVLRAHARVYPTDSE